MTVPQFAWNAGLLTLPPDKKIYSVPDIDMYNFCERATRGGLSQNRMPYMKSNMHDTKGFDPHKPISHIIYEDVCSLYGSSMRYWLPVGEFEWDTYNMGSNLDEVIEFFRTLYDKENDEMTVDEKYDIKFNNAPSFKMGETGYLAKIWGYWKPETHTNTNNDLNPLIVNRIIDKTCLINAQSYQCEPIVQKLVSSLLPVEGEVFDGCLIKMAIQQGFTITKFGQILKFRQEPFLKPFIDKVMDLRRNAKSVVEKDFFKLVINSFYGRLLMNKRWSYRD
jgi:hypothetical protein